MTNQPLIEACRALCRANSNGGCFNCGNRPDVCGCNIAPIRQALSAHDAATPDVQAGEWEDVWYVLCANGRWSEHAHPSQATKLGLSVNDLIIHARLPRRQAVVVDGEVAK